MLWVYASFACRLHSRPHDPEKRGAIENWYRQCYDLKELSCKQLQRVLSIPRFTCLRLMHAKCPGTRSNLDSPNSTSTRR